MVEASHHTKAKMSRRRSQQQDNDLGMEPDAVEAFHNTRERNLREKASKSKFARFGYQQDDNGLSDEEVMAIKRASDNESDDEDLYGNAPDTSAKDDELDWGSKRDTYYGADEADNEDDAKMEEEEAMRLQKKKLSSMKKSDFFEQDDFAEWEKSAKDSERKDDVLEDAKDESVRRVLESLPTQDPSKLSDKDRSQLLETLYPEVTPLAEEFTSLNDTLTALKSSISDFQQSKDQALDSVEGKQHKINLVKHAALSAYIGTLNTYFALFIVNASGDEKINLKEHPVTEGILRGRQLWSGVKNLKIVGDEDDSEDEVSSIEQATYSDKDAENSSDEGDNIFDTDALVKSVKSKEKLSKRKRQDVDADSDSEFGEDFSGFYNDNNSDNENEEEVPLDDEEESEPERDSDYDSDLELEFPIADGKSQKKSKRKTKHDPADDYGESAVINDADLDDKMERKRNLRYYTSKIDQAAKKSRSKLTGDSDLPYRERMAERERRLAEQARLRGLKNGQDDDDAERFSDSDNDDNNMPSRKNNAAKSKEDQEAEDYYNLVKKQSENRKQSRREAHDMAVKAAKQGKLGQMLEDKTVGEDGKRAISYQILKNKGITSGKKRKEKRNARVSKRAKYEKAQQKLKSVRRVYQQSSSSYGGEETGIKKNITRSVKFSS